MPLPNSDSAGRWSTTACSGRGGRYLDAPEYDEVWSALESLGVRATSCTPAPRRPSNGRSCKDASTVGASWSWAGKVGGHALRMVYSRMFDRHPETIFGQWVSSAFTQPTSALQTIQATLPFGLLRHQHGIHHQRVFSPATILGAVMEVGADAVLFSVDYPYESSAHAVAGVERTTLSASDRDKIATATPNGCCGSDPPTGRP